MNHPSESDLLGYVLGALDAQEQRDLQQQIDQNPEIEERLLEIKSSLVPLDLLESVGHRPGLARRTCEAVFQSDPEERRQRLAFLDAEDLTRSAQDTTVRWQDDAPAGEAELEPAAAKMTPVDRRFVGRVSSWSRTDLVAAVAMLGVLASLLFPVVAHTRFQARMTGCQDNLRRLGQGATLYGDLHPGDLFTFPTEGNLSVVGSFVLALKDSGLIDDAWLDCPGSDQFQRPLLPARAAIEGASDPALIEHLQRMLAGDYGLPMGYQVEGRFVIPGENGLDHTVLMADRPSTALPGRGSLNHGGAYNNILFAGGAVQELRGNCYGEDNLYTNDYGLVAPGTGPGDNVIVPGHLSPVHWQQLRVPENSY